MQGLLLVDKPAGLTSHDVVSRVRRLAGLREVGHAGTLDPQATGLLVLALGMATRWLDWLPSDKTYIATLRLGLRTDTEDIWGAVRSRHAGPLPSPEQVREQLLSMVGARTQVPPMVSALKQGGRKLYELAREGRTVERPARAITIHRLRVLGQREDETDLEVACSAGTYVRSLCAEAGEALGCGACLAALRRTASGPFRVEDAVPLAALERDGLNSRLLGHAEALAHLPAVLVEPDEATRLRHGQDLRRPAVEGPCRLVDAAGSLVALAHPVPGGLHPEKVFPDEGAATHP
jgi:tRNA pseudouridine55 synthase